MGYIIFTIGVVISSNNRPLVQVKNGALKLRIKILLYDQNI